MDDLSTMETLCRLAVGKMYHESKGGGHKSLGRKLLVPSVLGKCEPQMKSLADSPGRIIVDNCRS